MDGVAVPADDVTHVSVGSPVDTGALVGKKIEVLDPTDGCWRAGLVKKANADIASNLIRYEDGQKAWVDLQVCEYKYWEESGGAAKQRTRQPKAAAHRERVRERIALRLRSQPSVIQLLAGKVVETYDADSEGFRAGAVQDQETNGSWRIAYDGNLVSVDLDSVSFKVLVEIGEALFNRIDALSKLEIELFMPEYSLYYPATVKRVNVKQKSCLVCFHNGDKEWLDLGTRKYKVIIAPKQTVVVDSALQPSTVPPMSPTESNSPSLSYPEDIAAAPMVKAYVGTPPASVQQEPAAAVASQSPAAEASQNLGANVLAPDSSLAPSSATEPSPSIAPPATLASSASSASPVPSSAASASPLEPSPAAELAAAANSNTLLVADYSHASLYISSSETEDDNEASVDDPLCADALKTKVDEGKKRLFRMFSRGRLPTVRKAPSMPYPIKKSTSWLALHQPMVPSKSEAVILNGRKAEGGGSDGQSSGAGGVPPILQLGAEDDWSSLTQVADEDDTYLETPRNENGSKSPWGERWDAGCNRSYYYNQQTGESRWKTDMPADADDFAYTEQGAGIVWYEMVDAGSGHPYWLHARTGVSQWEPPKWLDQTDSDTGVRFFVNNITGESQWDTPAEYELIARQQQLNHGSGAEHEAAAEPPLQHPRHQRQQQLPPVLPRACPPLPAQAQARQDAAGSSPALGCAGGAVPVGNPLAVARARRKA